MAGIGTADPHEDLVSTGDVSDDMTLTFTAVLPAD